jgi:protein-tyrosine phosphatase
VTDTARILTVCTGNICRSPFLERALQHELDESWGAGAVEVVSGGTGALAGHPMEEQAEALLKEHGYAADGFRAQHLTADLVAGADLVLTATRAHRGKVAALHPRALRYVFAFREFADLASGVPEDELGKPGEGPREHVTRIVTLAAAQRGLRPPLDEDAADIVDPYRRPPEVFDAMTRQIMDALPGVVRALRRP